MQVACRRRLPLPAGSYDTSMQFVALPRRLLINFRFERNGLPSDQILDNSHFVGLKLEIEDLEIHLHVFGAGRAG